ncbi:MAG TPA: SAM-dependent methyltransferase, partial [Acidimicrobiales bacterium]|nr:SAM-dependent methyltransferase [Acidimicrobiales bacterium]
MASLAERIAGRARRFGPLPWSVFMEAALYDEVGGFYQSGGAAGRGGDFVTSPELGPLFAETMARALDRWWDELGRPDPFFVVEAGAGVGTLARDVLAVAPACSPALRYVLVERSAALREAHVDRLALELPAFVLGASAPAGADSDDEGVRYVPAQGPMATSLAELPALTMTGVILANELLDNLPFDLVELRNESWQEVRVGAAGDGDELVEVLVPASPDLAAEA